MIDPSVVDQTNITFSDRDPLADETTYYSVWWYNYLRKKMWVWRDGKWEKH